MGHVQYTLAHFLYSRINTLNTRVCYLKRAADEITESDLIPACAVNNFRCAFWGTTQIAIIKDLLDLDRRIMSRIDQWHAVAENFADRRGKQRIVRAAKHEAIQRETVKFP